MFILGAGFSNAVFDQFPGTDKLGNLALGNLRDKGRIEEQDSRIPVGGFHRGTFETWLARLAEDQPYLSTAENLRNRALFTEVTRAVREVLVSIEEEATSALPEWLFELVSAWHARRAEVITLNYDTLVESAVAFHLLADSEARGLGPGFAERSLVTPSDVLDGLPPASSGARLISGKGLRSFRIWKLHGSTSWFWVPGDTTGATIGRWEKEATSRDGDPEVEAERRRDLPGREPFVIPPTTTKASFYDNPLTREIWTRAHAAIRQADRVFIVGYSLPMTDVSVTGLVADALKERGGSVEVHVVDKEPGPVRRRLEELGAYVAPECPEGRSVKNFAHTYVDEAARSAVEHLRKWKPQPHKVWVRCSWGTESERYALGVVGKVSREEGTGGGACQAVVELAADATTGPPEHGSFPDLLEMLDSVKSVVLYRGKRRFMIVDCRASPQRHDDAGNVCSWRLDLLPAGRAPQTLVKDAPRPSRYNR